MNYSKPMTINFKRILVIWLITFLVGGMLGILFPPRFLVKANTSGYFFTQEVQEPELEPEPVKISLGEYRITAYCPCEICCGKWAKNRPNGIVVGAYQSELKEGISVASTLPNGTNIYVEGIGEFVVQDKIADWVIKEHGYNVIDIYFENHEDAKAFGLQHKEIFIIKGGNEDD